MNSIPAAVYAAASGVGSRRVKMTSEAVTPDPGPLHAGFFVSVESRVNGDTGSRSPAQPGPGEDSGAANH